ncbi:MAG: dimethyl sulfoxide reductase anchor subunit, partial [Gemmatimonadetes bacterium]|nr:dimethyl sulfoxide reductase anchor subunit [Gemmatimonadota bacterium]
MHPAWSVILLTTLIGVGQGLFASLVAVQALRLVPAGAAFYWAGAALALVFLAAGLIASFFHLGHPERAWRAAAMWRTSWLSREVIVLPGFMACVFAYGVGHALGWPAAGTFGTLAIGALGLVLCAALFVCTAMIYA